MNKLTAVYSSRLLAPAWTLLPSVPRDQGTLVDAVLATARACNKVFSGLKFAAAAFLFDIQAALLST